MSVSANQLHPRKDTVRGNLPVAASTRIYEGTLVFGASGYADDDTGSGANKFEGLALEEKDNSGGSAGDLNVEICREGIFPLIGSGFSQASVGKLVFATDNYTITLDGSAANAVLIGIHVGHISSTVGEVMLLTSRSGLQSDRIGYLTIPVLPHASLTEQNLFIAPDAMQVLAISGVPDLVQGGALTGTVCKASGTATPALGTTPMHTGTINFNATAHTVQDMTLTGTAADLILAAGDRIGLDLSAALTTGRANVLIKYRRL